MNNHTTLMKAYTSTQLTAMKQEELVKIILELQTQNNTLQKTMESLREDVANQCKDLEMQEEKEINNFRRLSEECAQQNIPIEVPDERAGSSIDRVGSLTGCITRSEPAIVSLASYTSGVTTGDTSRQFMIGSMQASIQKMSNSLSAFNQLDRPQHSGRSLEMKSFTAQGVLGQPSGPKQPTVNLNKFQTQTTTQRAAKMQQKKISIAQAVEEESDDNDVIM